MRRDHHHLHQHHHHHLIITSSSSPVCVSLAGQLAEARADALPPFLQLDRQAWREHSTELDEVQRNKARAIEHVR